MPGNDKPFVYEADAERQCVLHADGESYEERRTYGIHSARSASEAALVLAKAAPEWVRVPGATRGESAHRVNVYATPNEGGGYVGIAEYRRESWERRQRRGRDVPPWKGPKPPGPRFELYREPDGSVRIGMSGGPVRLHGPPRLRRLWTRLRRVPSAVRAWWQGRAERRWGMPR